MRKLFLYSLVAWSTLGCHETVKQKPDVSANGYPTGILQGVRFSDLYASYLGIANNTKLGPYLAIDFSKNLAAMWQRKMEKSGTKVVAAIAKQLQAEYASSVTLCSIEQYADHIDSVIDDTKASIHWDEVARQLNMRTSDIALVRDITGQFTGRDMVSYIMTELLPSANGLLNRDVLDFLLRNAGKEYVESIPALYDTKGSFGPYQFTEYALFCTPKGVRGASVINIAVDKSKRIPGSVMYLRGDDHHRAAYLFIVYNMCHLVKRLSTRQMKLLQACWKSHKTDLFLYCATAHHNPAAAIAAARKWLDNNARYPFESSCNRRISEYARKTRNNLLL